MSPGSSNEDVEESDLGYVLEKAHAGGWERPGRENSTSLGPGLWGRRRSPPPNTEEKRKSRHKDSEVWKWRALWAGVTAVRLGMTRES